MKLNYCLMVTGSPLGSQKSNSAFLFASTLLNNFAHHRLISVFFYHDGVFHINKFVSFSNKEDHDLIYSWTELSFKYDFLLRICYSSSLRRGLVNSSCSKKLSQNIIYNNINKGFRFSGLGDFFKDLLICDRFIQF